MSTNTIAAGRARSDLTISYTPGDVEVIRSQIIQGEALKRRWMILGLLIVTGALATVIVLLYTSYALYSNASTKNKELTHQSLVNQREAEEARHALDEKTAREEANLRRKNEASQLMRQLLPSVTSGVAVSPNVGGKFAKALFETGGRIESETKPSDKLFRNWKVNSDSMSEIYTVVGGFTDGKWVIYSNLVSRRQKDPFTN